MKESESYTHGLIVLGGTLGLVGLAMHALSKAGARETRGPFVGAFEDHTKALSEGRVPEFMQCSVRAARQVARELKDPLADLSDVEWARGMFDSKSLPQTTRESFKHFLKANRQRLHEAQDRLRAEDYSPEKELARLAAKRRAEQQAVIDAGQVPEDLRSNVEELRRLSRQFSLPFPASLTDAKLAEAVYYSRGPRAVLNLIEQLFDLHSESYKFESTILTRLLDPNFEIPDEPRWSTALESLKKIGLTVERPDPEDDGYTIWELTPKGAERASSTQARLREAHEQDTHGTVTQLGPIADAIRALGKQRRGEE